MQTMIDLISKSEAGLTFQQIKKGLDMNGDDVAKLLVEAAANKMIIAKGECYILKPTQVQSQPIGQKRTESANKIMHAKTVWASLLTTGKPVTADMVIHDPTIGSANLQHVYAAMNELKGEAGISCQKIKKAWTLTLAIPQKEEQQEIAQPPEEIFES